MRRRRVSAESCLSRRGLRSSLRLLCPPAPRRFPPPTSRAPACPGHAHCCCGNKEGPRGGGGGGGGATSCGSDRPAAAAPRHPTRLSLRARTGPTAPASRASPAPGPAGRKIWLRRLTRPQGPCCVVQDVAFMGILGQMECVLFATKNIFRDSRIVAE